MSRLPDSLQLHVLAVECEAAWIGDVHRFHRHDNVVAGETNRASSGITVTVFPRELRSVAVDLTGSGGIGGGAVPIRIGCIEGNFECVATLMDAELKHALPVQKFLVYEFAVELCQARGQNCSNYYQ